MPEPGTTRPAGEGATCAAEPCLTDAILEVLHRLDDGRGIWVPLCQPHYDSAPTDEVEYLVEVHGFVPPTQEST